MTNLNLSSAERIVKLLTTFSDHSRILSFFPHQSLSLSHLFGGRDIDILVHPTIYPLFRKNIIQLGYLEFAHPYHLDHYLYSMHSFKFFRHCELPPLDICFELSVRSIDKVHWLPLDNLLQEEAYKNSSNAFYNSCH